MSVEVFPSVSSIDAPLDAGILLRYRFDPVLFSLHKSARDPCQLHQTVLEVSVQSRASVEIRLDVSHVL